MNFQQPVVRLKVNSPDDDRGCSTRRQRALGRMPQHIRSECPDCALIPSVAPTYGTPGKRKCAASVRRLDGRADVRPWARAR